MKYFILMFVLIFFVSSISADIPIAPLEEMKATITDAQIVRIRGMLSADRRKILSVFTPPRDGLYRFEIAELPSNVKVHIAIFDTTGEAIASVGGVGNGNGVTLYSLREGKPYRVQVGQQQGFGTYTLLIGCQKESVDASAVTRLDDSMQYTDQQNRYFFTPSMDGNYRFEIAGLRRNTKVSICAFDAAGTALRFVPGISSGGGLTLNNLTGGEPYEIQVIQHTGFSAYTLNIGLQKKSVPIGIDTVYDSVQYTDQRNVYFFTPPIDGRYRFEVGALTKNASLSVYAFDEAGTTLQYAIGIGNTHGLTLSGLTAGATYQIQVRQHGGFSSYTLFVMGQ